MARKKYINISYDEKTLRGEYIPTDRVESVEPDIYAQLNLLTGLMPNVVHVTRWKTPGKTQDPRFHDRVHEIIIIISGQGRFYIDKVKIPVKARDVILVKPGEVHGYIEGSRFEAVAIHFSLVSLTRMIKNRKSADAVPTDDFLTFLSRHYTKIRKVTMAEGSQIINKAVQAQEEFDQTGAGSRLMCSLATVELLVMVARNYLFAKTGTTLSREQVRDRDRILVDQVITHIGQHYMEPLDVDDIFKPFFLHPNYCRNIFKNVMGKPVRTFILEVRLQKAKNRIIDTDDTLEAIAGQCGFNDYFYFLRAFKKYHKVTPGSLRKTNRL